MHIAAIGSAIASLFFAGVSPDAPDPGGPERIERAYATMSLLSAPPSAGELQEGFLASLHRLYPQQNCSAGFRSTLRKAPEVEICVSYTGFKGRCERMQEDAFSCRVAFTLRVVSPSHPGVLRKLSSTTVEIEREDLLFTHDWRGWLWNAAPETVDGLVPAEFRNRNPFSVEEARN